MDKARSYQQRHTQENRSADRMELTRITVNGLPNRGNIFGTDTEAADVTYSESAEAEIDADGNAVVS